MKKLIRTFFLLFVITALVPILWTKIPAISQIAHALLDPLFGNWLLFHPTFGMIGITAFLSLLLSLLQKYTINQDEMRALKAQQKSLSEEMKLHKANPGKVAELTQKQFTEIMPKMFEMTMQSSLFSIIPFILLFRWFLEFFTLHPMKFFGVMSWFWAYLLLSIIFSSIFRKWFKLA